QRPTNKHNQLHHLNAHRRGDARRARAARAFVVLVWTINACIFFLHETLTHNTTRRRPSPEDSTPGFTIWTQILVPSLLDEPRDEPRARSAAADVLPFLSRHPRADRVDES